MRHGLIHFLRAPVKLAVPIFLSLFGLQRVVLAPHLGSATRDTRIAMGLLCVDALRDVLLEGRTPANAVV